MLIIRTTFLHRVLILPWKTAKMSEGGRLTPPYPTFKLYFNYKIQITFLESNLFYLFIYSFSSSSTVTITYYDKQAGTARLKRALTAAIRAAAGTRVPVEYPGNKLPG